MAERFESLTVKVKIMQEGSAQFQEDTHTFVIANQTVGKALAQAKRQALAGRKAPLYAQAWIA